MGVFFRSLLHAIYGGAITALAATTTGPLTLKGFGLTLAGGVLTGLIHFFSAK